MLGVLECRLSSAERQTSMQGRDDIILVVSFAFLWSAEQRLLLFEAVSDAQQGRSQAWTCSTVTVHIQYEMIRYCHSKLHSTAQAPCLGASTAHGVVKTKRQQQKKQRANKERTTRKCVA